MSLLLTEQEREEIRKALQNNDEGEVHVDLCPLCTAATWRSTLTDKPRAMVVCIGEEICNGCVEVARLHPTIFEWVAAVVAGQRGLQEIVARKETPP